MVDTTPGYDPSSGGSTYLLEPRDYSCILIDEPAEGVRRITLNRPDKRNALSVPLLEELVAQVRAAEGDDANRVIVLRGAGKVFCAGLDLAEATDPERAHRSAHAVADALKTIARCRLVTVARVHGAAIAGGAGLMAACDLIVAADDTKVGYPEVHRGLVAGLIMHFVVRQAPLRAVSELMLTGKLIDAKRAAELGLVNRAVADIELFEFVAQHSQFALRRFVPQRLECMISPRRP